MRTTPAPGSPAGLRILRRMGEWLAVGFYEALDEPWPRGYGRALRRLYENMAITVPPERLLIPHEPLPQSWSRESHGAWSPMSMILGLNHHSGLSLNTGTVDDGRGGKHCIVEARKREFPEYAGFIDALVADLQRRLVHFGGYTHSNPDIRRVVSEGFDAMEAELDLELNAVSGLGLEANAEELNLLLALKDYSCGVRTFHQRTCRALRGSLRGLDGDARRRRRQMADAFAHCFLTPATTFVEGLLAVNFTWMLDACDSIGRLDQALGPLFEADQRDGRLDLALARDMLDDLWRNFERFNSWNLQIGGFTPAGSDGTNALTLECIAACGRNHFRRPNVAFRITSQTPDAAVLAALRVLAQGSGRPALYNDDAYVRTLRGMDLGLTDEDAREIGFGGCTETMIAGLSNCGSLEGEINLAKALELALYDGFDPHEKRQRGPHTGAFAEFATFDAFYAAVKRQIQYMTDEFVAGSRARLAQRFHAGDPKLYRTFFTRDCVKRHKSFEAGGARYNWAVVSYQGIANLIDSLAAVRRCVFEEKKCAPAALLAGLAANFVGQEELRQVLLAAPKFGNDDASVDDLGRDIIGFAWSELYSHSTPRGGRYLASCILFVTYYGAGLYVGATPDGRRAGEVLTDSVGAAQGRDTHGPTALLNSVAKLPLPLAVGTPVLNLRFQRRVFETDAGLAGLCAVVRGFFAQGGLQLQLSVLDRDELLAAQREPEKYRDLIVRIGGYSEYFVNLGRELQDSVIARTEHGM